MVAAVAAQRDILGASTVLSTQVEVAAAEGASRYSDWEFAGPVQAMQALVVGPSDEVLAAGSSEAVAAGTVRMVGVSVPGDIGRVPCS